MIYHNDILCVSGSQLIITESNPDGLISKSLWDKWLRSGSTLVQRGGNGRAALVDFSTVPAKYQQLITLKFGNPAEQAAHKSFKDYVKADETAFTFYSTYKLSDGRELGTIDNGRYVKEYCTNASVLNAIKGIYTDQLASRRKLGGKMVGFWEKTADVIHSIKGSGDDQIDHSLPSSKKRLREVYEAYQSEGYFTLISKKFGNDNTLKVSSDLERLLMSLYTMKNKPFAADVHTLYNLFIDGKLELVDDDAVQLFNREDFRNKNGEYIKISDGTVWNYLNKPENRPVVDAMRNSQFGFNNMHRPHHHRKPPVYSFSKISMDDRDLPRKCKEGGRVKAYYAYDVTSGCVVGSAYSMDKDEALFLDCMQNMFRLIEKENFPMPMEVEVENHLVNKFFDDLHVMFSFVRICNPGNSQEKRAEHFNRAKKYGTEKKLQNGIGRWWAKSEAYRIDQSKVNNEFVEKLFPYENLVADDIYASLKYNATLHPNQKKYPNKTRWQVLVENINPNAGKLSKAVVYKSIGNKTETSINRNQYCRVQYEKYALPSVDVLSKLQPNNYEVQAYYLPDHNGIINEVYLYQGDVFICRSERIVEYNEAKAEWVLGEDDAAYKHQAKYVSQFDAKIKEGKASLTKISTISTELIEAAAEQEAEVVNTEIGMETDTSLEDFLNNYNPEDLAKQAIRNL